VGICLRFAKCRKATDPVVRLERRQRLFSDTRDTRFLTFLEEAMGKVVFLRHLRHLEKGAPFCPSLMDIIPEA
jgi:hypothetical protein